MPDKPNRDNPSDSPDLTANFLDIQRAGLQAIISLSTDSIGPVESDAADRLHRAVSEAEGALRSRLAEIESRTKADLANAEQLHEQQRTTAETEHQTAVTSLAKKNLADRERLIRNARQYEAGLDHQMQDQFLLADTVAQAACDRLRKEHRAFERQAEADLKKLEELKAHAEWFVHNSKIAEPADSALPTPTESATPEAAGSSPKHTRHMQLAAQHLESLEHLVETGRLRGGRIYATAAILALLVAAGFITLVGLKLPGAPPLIIALPATLIIAGIFAALASWTMRRRHRTQLLAGYLPFAAEVAAARREFDLYATAVRARHAQAESIAAKTRRDNPEKVTLKRKITALVAEMRQRQTQSLAELESSQSRQLLEIEQRRDAALAAAETEFLKRRDAIRAAAERDSATARDEHRLRMGDAESRGRTDQAQLDSTWKAGSAQISQLLDAGDRIRPEPEAPWQPRPAAADEFTALIPFGRWQLNLPQRQAESLQQGAAHAVTDSTPAVLAVPQYCSLLIQTDRAGRNQAIDALRVIMLRLLTTLPPGRVRFTIVDPLGLGESFAGFMHLADYEEALVGGRIWTDPEQIEARLTELTSHMENVIQKYLRNEFPSIDAYNRQAGQLAEPYRFLVVADFPANFTENAVRRFSSIISSGPRCGVFTLVMQDKRLKLPPEISLEDLAAGRLHLIHDNQTWRAEDPVRRKFSLQIDTPPAEDELTRLMHDVGRSAKNAFHVELPFDSIVPSAEQRWSRSAAEDLVIPIGHAGAVRLQYFNMGRGLAQHSLIAGKTGSGKSTLLHVIITNLALWYRPDEVELYLIDFKKGVEFKTYVTHALPHARAIAIESDREFGVSVLQRLDAEMTRRGDLFRAAGVQDLPAYREAARQPLPRTVLLVDEFQIFFAEDDRLSQEAAVLLDRLVRQGRAFGIHVVLGSQTLAGTAGLARSTMGQMAIRIALQCSEADSQLILDDTNVAARLLARPGEAIYNDAGGLVAGNSNFQIAWLSDDRQAELLGEVQSLARAGQWSGPPPIVFEGNALADIRQNHQLAGLIQSPAWPAPTPAKYVWLGDPVAIKDPTHITLRTQSGANAVLIGQREDVAQSLLAATIVCLAAQHSPQSARFIVLPGAAGETETGELRAVSKLLPDSIRWVEWRDVPAVIAELAGEVKQRLERGPGDESRVYLIINGMQRYRALRRQEDVFSMSSSDADAPPPTDRQFAELLREGPPLGIHVIGWADTYSTLERTLERQSIREFDNRVLFQMSAADSSNMIDSPEANRLGFHRALFFSEERGLLEKFRPYAPLNSDWLQEVQQHFAHRSP